ncbi:MAG: L,D-transpeptidase, partial [Candidatus Obscuribacterales bacterium]|nr:L,D-transpeptidase [Candidatus Obscuribacterales bacterium]
MRLSRYVALFSALSISLCVFANMALAATHGHTAAPKKGKQSATRKNDGVFVNNHYVLGPVMKMNGYHSDQPTVVVVDKGSHNTYALQLQNRGVVRVLTVSNAIGSQDKPTPSGRYVATGKKQYPEWIVPKTIKG